MTTLLHIEASPRGEVSQSLFGAGVFIRGLKARYSALVVDRLNVWDEPLPTFDGAALAAKYDRLANKTLQGDRAEAWGTIGEMVRRLDAADRILISTPMWNFGVPYRLKHYIDLITQPGLTFAFDPVSGYRPLLSSRPVMVVIASAGDYSKGRSWGRPDLASAYLAEVLKFIGLSETRFESVAPTVGQAEVVADARLASEQRLLAVAAAF
jgi:FMN-dependent NADH-azoreductase